MIFRQPRGALPLALLTLAALTACGGSDDNSDGGGTTPPPATYQTEIRRTEMGVPHIKAADWAGLG